MPGYSEEIAVRILKHLLEIFPDEGDFEEMKLRLVPSSEQLDYLTAMNALFKLELIVGKTLMTNRSIVGAMSVNISSSGREYLQRRNRPIEASDSGGTTVHGDLYNNYGPVGAIGPQSTGTINYQQQWGAIQNHVDLSALAIELEQLKKHLQRSASSSSDYQRLALLSEAEEHAKKHDGSKAMEVLSQVGKGVLGVAKDIGIEIAAKVIAKSMGLEP